jgi:6-phosphogluconolactonase (cycloisomerase 2 family)
MDVTPDGKYLYVLNQSSQNISAYEIGSVTGQLTPVYGSPFAGAGPSTSMLVDALGERIYLGAAHTIVAYTIFDNRGSIRSLPGSPFGGVSGASGLGFDLTNSFLYSANDISNTVSGFGVAKTTGVIVPLPDSPYAAGSNPASIVVVNNIN